MPTIYHTGCTLDGFIATDDHSLDWLTSRDIDMDGPMAYRGFRERIGACVMGATTWQWILDHDDDPWGPLPTWVMTHRTFPEAPASVRFAQDDVRRVHAEMTEVAVGKDVWVVGGGAPVLPRHVELRLEEVARNRDFMCGRYTVAR